MGNLGLYQLMTTVAKRVGGPAVLLTGVALAGYATLRPVEAGAKRAGRKLVSVIKSRRAQVDTPGQIYIVHTDTDAGGDLWLKAADRYRVLEQDGDAVLIEVDGALENPYVVSAALLAEVSDFAAGADQG